VSIRPGQKPGLIVFPEAGAKRWDLKILLINRIRPALLPLLFLIFSLSFLFLFLLIYCPSTI